ncbi:O-antigen ligase family protein [Luteibaculum oceani]|nr:O-antigen ligase family protein [Luteibaculum oceani]
MAIAFFVYLLSNQKAVKTSAPLLRVCGFLIITGVVFAWLLIPGDNFDHALNDIRIKAPILAFPLFFAYGPKISAKWRDRVLRIFLMASAGSALTTCVLAFSDLVGWMDLEFREYSPFFSHIRLSLNLVLAILLLVFVGDGLFEKKYRILLFVPMFLALIVLQSVTGLGILFLAALVSIKRLVKSRLGKLLVLLAILGVGYVGFEVVSYFIQRDQPQPNQESFITENGHYVHTISDDDGMARAWELKSNISIDSTSDRGYNLRGALLRYLSSKNLTKDSIGVAKLSQRDIALIEQGITNYKYPSWWPLKKRFEAIRFQMENYFSNGNPNSNSVGMRLVYWELGLKIFSERPWIGNGVQNLKANYAEAYESFRFKIDEKYRRRAHNQFLTFLICYGVLGFSLISLGFALVIFPWRAQHVARLFLLVLLVSFLAEDTLETQMGATFAGFWMAWFFIKGNHNKEA